MNTSNQIGEGRYLELEGLRGIMIFIIVFFMHYNWLMTNNYPIKILAIFYEKGYYFVETFFVLSGFGMSTGYREKLRRGTENVFLFLCRRMKKIWPIMTVALFTTSFLQIVHLYKFGHWYYVPEVTIYSFFLSLLNISSGWFVLDINLNMPLWYISALMFDYVIFYSICKLSKKSNSLYLFLIGVVAFWGLTIVITGIGSNKPFMYYNIARGHACFFVGVLLKEVIEYINIEKARAFLGCFLFVLFSVIMGFCFITHSETKILASSQWLSQMIWGNVLSPMLIFICMFFKPVKLLLTIKPLISLGGISSSLFIWHFPLYQLLRIFTWNYKTYYSSLWCYALIIIYMISFSIFSKKYMEPRLAILSKIWIHKLHKDDFYSYGE